jgi:hypothetical protein
MGEVCDGMRALAGKLNYGGVTVGANSTGWFQQDHNQFNFNFVSDYNRRIAFTGIRP